MKRTKEVREKVIENTRVLLLGGRLWDPWDLIFSSPSAAVRPPRADEHPLFSNFPQILHFVGFVFLRFQLLYLPQHLIKSMPSALEESWQRSQNQIWLLEQEQKKYLDAFPSITRGSNLPWDAWDALWLSWPHSKSYQHGAENATKYAWVWTKYMMLIFTSFILPKCLLQWCAKCI